MTVNLNIDVSGLAEGELAEASTVLIPFLELIDHAEKTLNGEQGFDGILLNTNEQSIDGSGAVSISKGLHTIDTESNDPTDDLTTINGLDEGGIALIRASDATRTVYIKHGSDNIVSATGDDISLDTDNKPVLLIGKDGNDVIAAPLMGADYAEKVAILRDEKSAGNNASGGSPATWNQRDINTKSFDPHSIVTIGSNRFVPIAGNYVLQVRGMAGIAGTNVHRLRLYNVTANVSVEEGLNGSMNNSILKSMASLECFFSANGTDQYRIDHYVSLNPSTSGFGQAVSDGSPEVYLEIVLRKRPA